MRIPKFNLDQLRQIEARQNFTTRALTSDLKLDPVLRHHLGLPPVKPLPKSDRKQSLNSIRTDPRNPE